MMTPEEWISHLRDVPRYIEVLSCRERTAVVRARWTAAGATLNSLLCLELTGETPVARWSGPGYQTAIFMTPNWLVAVRSTDQHALIESIDLGGSGETETLWKGAGRITGVSAAGTCLAFTTQLIGGGTRTRTPAALTGSSVVWSDAADASTGAARRQEGDRLAWRLDLTEGSNRRADPLAPNLGADHGLTGEIAACAGGTVALGVRRIRPDGMQRFGVMLLRPDGSSDSVFRSDLDLGGPISSPSGWAVTLTGTTTASPDSPPMGRPARLDVASAGLDVLTGHEDRWLEPVGWLDDDSVLMTSDVQSSRTLVAWHRDGIRTVFDARSVQSASTSGGTVGVLLSSTSHEPTLALVDVDTRTATWIDSTDAESPQPGRTRLVPTPVLDRQQLGAIVCEGLDSKRGLIAFFHGGPFKSWADWSWRWNPWPFVSAGYTVALIEPPMSLGYSLDAAHLGWRHWKDGLATAAVEQVKYVQAKIDMAEAPLALMGGSFGGYLALAASEALHPQLVVAHAAPCQLDRVADGSDTLWQWVREYGAPATNPDLYASQSIETCRLCGSSRYLFSHGLQDDLVPVSESLATHRALCGREVRSELALYPRAGHPLLDPGDIADWYQWVLDACGEEMSQP